MARVIPASLNYDSLHAYHHIEEDIFKGRIFIFSTCSIAQLLQCAFGHQDTLVDDSNAGTESFHNFHDVG